METMEKIELLHVLPYIPYAVKAIDLHGEIREVVYDMQTYTLSHTGLNLVLGEHVHGTLWNRHMLLLRPWSDLNREIEHEGEVFKPINKFCAEFKDDILNCNCFAEISMLPYQAVQKLISWHFDIFGLIKIGQAIDINSVKK